jgi:hypothetical protein
MVQPKSDGRPPDLKGFLSKWVNYRQGWKTRWFVLENGVLSYCECPVIVDVLTTDRNREDEQVACRGSIALATANLHPSSDGSRFEVSSAASTSVPKIIVKSSARGEIGRWVQAIRLNMEYYNRNGRPAAGLDRSTSAKAPSIHSTMDKLHSNLNELPAPDNFLHPNLKRSGTVVSGIQGNGGGTLRGRHVSAQSQRSKRDQSPAGNDTASDAASSNGDGSSDERQNETIPHESEFELSMLNLKAQLELTEQLIGSIVTPPSSSHGSPDPSRITPVLSRQQEVKEALRDSLSTITGLVQRQHEMTLDREQFFSSRIKREVQARKLWEDNLLAVAQQQAETDRQLTEAAKDNEKKRRALRQARGVLAEISLSTPASPQPEIAGQLVSPPLAMDSPELGASADFGPTGGIPAPLLQQSLRTTVSRSSVSGRGHNARRSISLSKSMSRSSISHLDVNDVVAAIDDSEDDDDEFFDAIETGTIPNLKMYDSIANTGRPATPSLSAGGAGSNSIVLREGTIEQYLSRKSLEPYAHVRHRLPIDDDKRPSVSCKLGVPLRELTSSVEHPQVVHRQGPHKDHLPGQLQRVHVDAAAHGRGHGVRCLPDCCVAARGLAQAYRVCRRVCHVKLLVYNRPCRQALQPASVAELRVRHSQPVPVHFRAGVAPPPDQRVLLRGPDMEVLR